MGWHAIGSRTRREPRRYRPQHRVDRCRQLRPIRLRVHHAASQSCARGSHPPGLVGTSAPRQLKNCASSLTIPQRYRLRRMASRSATTRKVGNGCAEPRSFAPWVAPSTGCGASHWRALGRPARETIPALETLRPASRLTQPPAPRHAGRGVVPALQLPPGIHV